MAGETPDIKRKTPSEHLLDMFDQHDLDREQLYRIATNFKALAHAVIELTPSGPEQTVCLRHLLDAKNAAVRALIPQ